MGGRPEPGPDNKGIPLFKPPFAGDLAVNSPFDHDLPFEFNDTNGYLLNWWGQKVNGVDGHNGYDFTMPEGTPLLAVADARVINAGPQSSNPCPILGGQTVAATIVLLAHTAPSGAGQVYRTLYNHMSRVDVQQGQMVKQGEQIGLSGNTGCSTGPHLHFETSRQVGSRFVQVDPFGWDGPGPDPWAQDRRGAPSEWLWDKAPALRRQARRMPNAIPGDNAVVTITALQWMGFRDEDHVNNQWLELTFDPRFATSGSWDMSGYIMRNSKGDVYRFPQGFRITRDKPVRLFAGTGQNTDVELYWGRTAPVWDAMGDCARLVKPNGQYQSRYNVISASWATGPKPCD